jgi:transketolase
MRAEFAKYLHDCALPGDPRLRLLTADIGYGLFDRIRLDYPGQFVDFGASEQLMVGAAGGMALSGLRPVCYSITPFLLYRPFEWLRNFLHHDQIPVKLVGGGRDRDYGHLGFTHWAEDDTAILATLPNIKVFKPECGSDFKSQVSAFQLFLDHPGPAYLNLKK